MAGNINRSRQQWSEVLAALQKKSNRLIVQTYEIIGHRRFTLSTREVNEKMRDSLLCPIPKGDGPFQKRLFDVMVAGLHCPLGRSMRK